LTPWAIPSFLAALARKRIVTDVGASYLSFPRFSTKEDGWFGPLSKESRETFVRSKKKEGTMLRQVNESQGKSDDGLASRLQEAVVLKNTEFFLAEGLPFVSVPEWDGWKYINHEKNESVDHFARWEVFLYPRGERFWIFLRITSPSLTQILLGFIYPDDRKLLEDIMLHRRLALLDHPLLEGRPHPQSTGILVDDIPTDLPEVFGIGLRYGRNAIQ
jgi:hypothetical protein